MRAGKPLPVLYTPDQGERGKYWPKELNQIHDRIYGHSYDSITAPVLVF